MEQICQVILSVGVKVSDNWDRDDHRGVVSTSEPLESIYESRVEVDLISAVGKSEGSGDNPRCDSVTRSKTGGPGRGPEGVWDGLSGTRIKN